MSECVCDGLINIKDRLLEAKEKRMIEIETTYVKKAGWVKSEYKGIETRENPSFSMAENVGY
jgi:hypothetical protein